MPTEVKMTDLTELEKSRITVNDLPELPFEKILGYLSLEDLIRFRRVSKRCKIRIDSFRVKYLCFSRRPIGFILEGMSRIVSGEFAANFICSSKFESFFQTFGQSILFGLKHLHLCKLHFNAESIVVFIRMLNSFGQLEELGLFDFSPKLDTDFQLNLPLLKSVQLEDVRAIKKLTLDTPRLKNVRLVESSFDELSLHLVHGESVEKLIISVLNKMMEVAKLKNLKYLHCGYHSRWASIDPTLLSTLDQLKEIHLHFENLVLDLFEQKARYGRSNLKIFLFGCLLNGPNDPAIESASFKSIGHLRFLIENPARLAKEVPLRNSLEFWEIKAVARKHQIGLLNKFTDLKLISVDDEPIRDVDRFLELLKNLNNVVKLCFGWCGQPQEVLDRLHDYCAIQFLEIHRSPENLNFLLGLKSLIQLNLCFTIDTTFIEFIPKLYEELPFLSCFLFMRPQKGFIIEIDHSNQYTVFIGGSEVAKKLSDIDAAIKICEKELKSENGKLSEEE